MRDDDTPRRIRDDDELIALDAVRDILGGMSVATAYVDGELMALKISMTAGERRTHSVRWIKREILELRAQRVERADANAETVKAEIAARVERRRERQRLRVRTKRAAREPAD